MDTAEMTFYVLLFFTGGGDNPYQASPNFGTIGEAECWVSGRNWHLRFHSAQVVTRDGYVREYGKRVGGAWHWSTAYAVGVKAS